MDLGILHPPTNIPNIFEVSSGDSYWKISKTAITCHSSDLVKGMRPFYLDRVVYWLRNDGSIVAFNTVTEKTQLIQTTGFPNSKTLFLCAFDTELTLLTAREQVIFVYSLKNNTKWVVVRRIPNKSMKVAAYDGRFLVLTDATKIHHEYDLRANKWTIITQGLSDCNNNDQEFFQLRPSSSSVVGLNNLIGMKKDLLLQVQPQTSTLINRLSLFLIDKFPSPPPPWPFHQTDFVPCELSKGYLDYFHV